MKRMLGERIKEMRKAKGFVQRKLAFELQAYTAYISKMESNEKPVSGDHLTKSAALFSVSESELLKPWLVNKNQIGLLEEDDVRN